MKGTVEVLEAGLFTTIQDPGRVGFRKYGIPVSGVMDEHSAKLANWLTGNPETVPVLELTLLATKFKFHHHAVIGITGARAEVWINGQSFPQNQTLILKAGDILKIGRVQAGCRVYLSIRGQWDIDPVMGSLSTCFPANFGGFNGRSLKEGEDLTWTDLTGKTVRREVPKKWLPHYSSVQHIRILEGPEWGWLDEDQQDIFLEREYEVSTQSNRMGIRLQGNGVLKLAKKEMRSAPVVPGMIQLPRSGKPIILMNDGQSVGGYPRVAKVVDADLWRLGQAWAPVKLRFKKVTLDEAIKLRAFQKNMIY